MTDEEFTTAINSEIEDTRYSIVARFTELVKQKIENEISVSSLTAIVEESGTIRRMIREYFEKSVATEIGNRLRCGIYDGLKMDDVFESVWNEQFDRAIQDRIRQKVHSAIDTVVAERLKKING